MMKTLKMIMVFVILLIDVSFSLNLLETGNILDTLTKTLQDETTCDRPSANKTTPYFFGVTDLKCLNVEARLRKDGYNVEELRQQFPHLIGKRSITIDAPLVFRPNIFSKTKIPEGEIETTIKRQKRSPSRNTLRPVHRWIFYDGYFIEFGAGSGNIGKNERKHVYIELEQKNELGLSNANMQTLYPKNGDICAAKMESEVAGYSSVSLDCIYNCARSYVSKFGEYNLVNNNCHRFANTISDILCTGVCPKWCV